MKGRKKLGKGIRMWWHPYRPARKPRVMWFMPRIGLFMVLLGAGFLAGCGTLPNGRGWGQDATPFPEWRRIRIAAVGAALELDSWVPAAVAMILQVGDMDENLSDWAADHRPLFGSHENAKRASDYLREAAGVAYLVTALSTPGGTDQEVWAVSKLKGIAVGAAALSFNYGVTEILKDITNRTRPDVSNNQSFPSHHASSAAVLATLASRNLQSLPLSQRDRNLLRAGFTTLAAGSAWARVEAQRHYTSDVLAGYAIGHFLGAFINDAFLGLAHQGKVGITIEPSRNSILVGLRWIY